MKWRRKLNTHNFGAAYLGAGYKTEDKSPRKLGRRGISKYFVLIGVSLKFWSLEARKNEDSELELAESDKDDLIGVENHIWYILSEFWKWKHNFKWRRPAITVLHPPGSREKVKIGAKGSALWENFLACLHSLNTESVKSNILFDKGAKSRSTRLVSTLQHLGRLAMREFNLIHKFEVVKTTTPSPLPILQPC